MNHGHDHNHAEGSPRHDHHRRTDERKRLLWAIIATLTILIVEAVGGFFSGSLALISDAGHMFVDSLSLIVSYVALSLARRPVTDTFTYGFRRAEIIAAFLNGVTLLFVCAYISYEAVNRFLAPTEIDLPVMLAVAGVGLTANLVSALLLFHAESLNVRSAFLHVLGDLFSSVGVILAAVVMMFWDAPWLDPALSLAISGVILFSAYRLTREALGILMEAAPKGIDAARVRKTLLAVPGVGDVHDLHLWCITPGQTALSCHVIATDGGGSGNDALIIALNTSLETAYGITHTTIQIETTGFGRHSAVCDDRHTG